MKRVLKLFRQSKCGASAVEFALVLPVFLLMLFGIVEFGRLFWTSHALQETAIATARCMGVPQVECSLEGIYNLARATAFAESTSNGWFVTLDPTLIRLDHDADCRGLNGFSSVAIEYQFRTAVPKLIDVLAGGTELKASACYPNQ
ncbi:pilus assembly protein [Phyllobacterium salinisoli]|uniref:Pilus assembly protein n=1 Tax=Phyllobacterium salinisoli TaxID=1899321 RepID=A0A368K0X8_9HYPH|nr:TadE family protein [Phyllobacterium salinisoli]RCS23048.1 pilus assembly protein [Phyllobacterium salinisoli]